MICTSTKCAFAYMSRADMSACKHLRMEKGHTEEKTLREVEEKEVRKGGKEGGMRRRKQWRREQRNVWKK